MSAFPCFLEPFLPSTTKTMTSISSYPSAPPIPKKEEKWVRLYRRIQQGGNKILMFLVRLYDNGIVETKRQAIEFQDIDFDSSFLSSSSSSSLIQSQIIFQVLGYSSSSFSVTVWQYYRNKNAPHHFQITHLSQLLKCQSFSCSSLPQHSPLVEGRITFLSTEMNENENQRLTISFVPTTDDFYFFLQHVPLFMEK